MVVNRKSSLRCRDAADERQYMLSGDYEVYEKVGEPVGAVSFHYHDFYELIYIIEGEFSSLIEDRAVMLRELAAGEPFLAECFWGAGPKLYHFPIYYEEILRGFLLKLAMSEILEGDDVQNCGIRKVMDRGNLSLFFGYLNVLCKREEYLSSTQEIVDHPLVEQVTGYIETHLSQEITVEEVAEAVHMSKYHFLRKFKEITGMTVHNFIVNKRIISACQAMAEGKNITESWQQTGFADYSSFLRNFRKIYGISPKEYRENNRSLIISQ